MSHGLRNTEEKSKATWRDSPFYPTCWGASGGAGASVFDAKEPRASRVSETAPRLPLELLGFPRGINGKAAAGQSALPLIPHGRRDAASPPATRTHDADYKTRRPPRPLATLARAQTSRRATELPRLCSLPSAPPSSPDDDDDDDEDGGNVGDFTALSDFFAP